mgnify:CR=1 FL=1
MAVRRGPSYAVTTPILTPSAAGMAGAFTQFFSSMDQSIIQFSTSMLNSLTSFGGGTTTTYGGTTGGYYYKLLADFMSGLF